MKHLLFLLTTIGLSFGEIGISPIWFYSCDSLLSNSKVNDLRSSEFGQLYFLAMLHPDTTAGQPMACGRLDGSDTSKVKISWLVDGKKVQSPHQFRDNEFQPVIIDSSVHDLTVNVETGLSVQNATFKIRSDYLKRMSCSLVKWIKSPFSQKSVRLRIYSTTSISIDTSKSVLAVLNPASFDTVAVLFDSLSQGIDSLSIALFPDKTHNNYFWKHYYSHIGTKGLALNTVEISPCPTLRKSIFGDQYLDYMDTIQCKLFKRGYSDESIRMVIERKYFECSSSIKSDNKLTSRKDARVSRSSTASKSFQINGRLLPNGKRTSSIPFNFHKRVHR